MLVCNPLSHSMYEHLMGTTIPWFKLYKYTYLWNSSKSRIQIALQIIYLHNSLLVCLNILRLGSTLIEFLPSRGKTSDSYFSPKIKLMLCLHNNEWVTNNAFIANIIVSNIFTPFPRSALYLWQHKRKHTSTCMLNSFGSQPNIDYIIDISGSLITELMKCMQTMVNSELSSTIQEESIGSPVGYLRPCARSISPTFLSMTSTVRWCLVPGLTIPTRWTWPTVAMKWTWTPTNQMVNGRC